MECIEAALEEGICFYLQHASRSIKTRLPRLLQQELLIQRQ